jgi:hypothetical protein
MAIKTGFSHSLATLLLTVVGALLIHFLRHVGSFEKIFDFLLLTSFRFSQWLEQSMGIVINYELFPTVFIAAILAFVWGILFHVTRK